MSRYADILLPLALPGTLTYAVPPALGKISVGQRVVVPLGRAKFYTGIVVRLSDTAPADGMTLKEIIEVEDTTPIVQPGELRFWKWMSDYYMCTPGEVMKAALPSGLKMESETVVAVNEDFEADSEMVRGDAEILLALRRGEMSVGKLQSSLRRASIMPAVRRLLDIGAISVHESLSRQFRPRTETHVRLAQAYCSEKSLNALFDTLRRTPRQEQLLLSYLDLADAGAALSLGNPSLFKEVSKKLLLGSSNASEFALAALKAKGVLETYAFEIGRLRPFTATTELGLGLRPLAEGQQRAYDETCRHLWGSDAEPADASVCLLHGVTSSGKTEIYTRLIQDALSRGEQVLYLLPEIALTTQITTRLGRVFGSQMGVYHSRFPDAERVEVWRRQLSDQAFPLILGVRSSLFLPFRKLGLIIVDEEHETSYKQQDPAPRYNARDAAIVLSRQRGAKVVLGTATPSLETYRNALAGKYALVELTERYGGVQMPEIVVDDVKELRRKKLMKTPFSPRLTTEIRNALERKEQVILFQNRRGYSPVLECRTCGWTPHCTRCDVALTFHQKSNRLVCHYCGTSYNVPGQCPNCEDTELRDVGYGTEKIEAAVHAVFPEARTARMDLDTTRSRQAYERIINDFQQGDTDILIGTQMVTKGLDFDRVSVVGILNADQGLNVADFRAYERTFQMLSQVAGRAGRRGKRGLVVLQTRQPELPIISQIVRGDYAAMFRSQIEERELFHYPPLYHVINIYVRHRDSHTADEAAQALAGLLRPHFGAELLGPDRPLVSRVQLLHIRKLLLKVSPDLPVAGVRRTLNAARQIIAGQPAFKAAIVTFDVDPL